MEIEQDIRNTFPESVIEAAAKNFHTHKFNIYALGKHRYGVSCSCGFSQEVVDTLSYNGWVREREAVTAHHMSKSVLEDALAECQAQEQWIVEVDFGRKKGFEPRPFVYQTEEQARDYMRGIVLPKRLKRRLVIFTPLEVVE